MAELADAEGLNPSDSKESCGFKSHSGHTLTRENIQISRSAHFANFCG